MLKKSLAAIAIVTWLSGTAAAQDARTVINNASRAMGADTLKTIQYSAVGNDFAVGQSYSPTSPWPKFVNITYTRAIDFQVPASRVDRIRIQGETPPHGGGLQPVTVRARIELEFRDGIVPARDQGQFEVRLQSKRIIVKVLRVEDALARCGIDRVRPEEQLHRRRLIRVPALRIVQRVAKTSRRPQDQNVALVPPGRLGNFVLITPKLHAGAAVHHRVRSAVTERVARGRGTSHVPRILSVVNAAYSARSRSL